MQRRWIGRSIGPRQLSDRTLTLIPVLASYWFKNGVREKHNRAFEWMKRKYAAPLDWALNRPKTTIRSDAHTEPGARLLLVQERRARETQSGIRMDEEEICSAVGLGAQSAQDNYQIGRSH